MIVMYAYYKWNEICGLKDFYPDPQQYMIDLHKIVEEGYFKNVDYCGQLNSTCGGTTELGLHYGMVFIGDKETLKDIKNLIEADCYESFEMGTMEKLDKDLNKVELAL